MSRRTGNNYSGPRWAFSDGERKPVTPTHSVEPSGFTRSGSSRERPAAVSHGRYELIVNLGIAAGRMVISRQDPDDHKRSVAFVDSLAEWDRFVAALEAGLDEVAAVHAIDKGD